MSQLKDWFEFIREQRAKNEEYETNCELIKQVNYEKAVCKLSNLSLNLKLLKRIKYFSRAREM